MARSIRNLLTEADGRALAVAMLRHFWDVEDDQHSIEAMYRTEGTQQDNVVLRYVGEAAAGNADALTGFCAVLTDYIGSAVGGSVPDEDIYENLTEREVTGKPGPWPTAEAEEKEEKAAVQRFMSRLQG